MEEFEDDFVEDWEDGILITIGWNSYDVEQFLARPSFIWWYEWAHITFRQEGLTNSEMYDRIRNGNLSLTDGTNFIIKDLLEDENYEMIIQVKAHSEKIWKDGMLLADKVKRFL